MLCPQLLSKVESRSPLEFHSKGFKVVRYLTESYPLLVLVPTNEIEK